MLYPDRALALARKALQNGASLRTTKDGKVFHRHVEWSVSGNCSNPVTVEQHSRPSKRGFKTVVLPSEGKHLTVTMEVPCRNCENCLRRRAAHWRLRAMSEYGQSARTWFCTLTFTPDQHVRFRNMARVYWSKAGVDWDARSEAERFGDHHSEASKELTLFIKRLRKNTDAPFTYLLVCEAHKSGLPHYHALFHEKDPMAPVRHKEFVNAWRGGHAKFNLVHDPRAATYACKYLSKSVMARVRASIKYGE